MFINWDILMLLVCDLIVFNLMKCCSLLAVECLKNSHHIQENNSKLCSTFLGILFVPRNSQNNPSSIIIDQLEIACTLISPRYSNLSESKVHEKVGLLL